MAKLFSKNDLIDELYSNKNNIYGIEIVERFGSSYLPLFLANIRHEYESEFKALIIEGIKRNDEFCKALSYLNHWYEELPELNISGLISLNYLASLSQSLSESCKKFILLNETRYLKSDLLFDGYSVGPSDRKNDYLYKLIKSNIINSENISFSEIMNILRQSKDLWDKLDSGRKILEDQDELAQYLWSYGKMIAQQWRQGRDLIVPPEKGSILIDYGCGQGTGVSLFLDSFSIEFRKNISQIFLIEPSNPALHRAHNLAQCYCPDAVIVAFLTKLDGFSDYSSFESRNQIHLFSNILDVEGLDVEKIAHGLLLAPGTKTIYIASTDRKFSGGISQINLFISTLKNSEKIKSWDIKNINISTHLDSKQFFRRIIISV